MTPNHPEGESAFCTTADGPLGTPHGASRILPVPYWCAFQPGLNKQGLIHLVRGCWTDKTTKVILFIILRLQLFFSKELKKKSGMDIYLNNTTLSIYWVVNFFSFVLLIG